MRGPCEVIRNEVAYEKAQRRKANRLQRKSGERAFDLHALNLKAREEVQLRCKLADMAQAGVPGAAKAKRKLNDNWTNRKAKSLTGFWNEAHA